MYTKEETILKKIALILAILTLFSFVSILLIGCGGNNSKLIGTSATYRKK